MEVAEAKVLVELEEHLEVEDLGVQEEVVEAEV